MNKTVIIIAYLDIISEKVKKLSSNTTAWIRTPTVGSASTLVRRHSASMMKPDTELGGGG